MTPSSVRVQLEICIASVEDAVAAVQGGADRLELNAALELGGLTPSLGLMREARAAVPASVPIIAMIRPRPAGFAYSLEDMRVMTRDLELMLNNGADGIVFGVLRDDGAIDEGRCRLLIKQARAIDPNKDCVFHRAFDVVPDPTAALETLIALGFTRVMTSGQEESAYNGLALIAKLIRQAAGRIEILPAGGVNGFTLKDIIERTGCDQVHASLRMTRFDESTAARPKIGFGKSFRPPEDRYEGTSPAAVASLRDLLNGG